MCGQGLLRMNFFPELSSLPGEGGTVMGHWSSEESRKLQSSRSAAPSWSQLRLCSLFNLVVGGGRRISGCTQMKGIFLFSFSTSFRERRAEEGCACAYSVRPFGLCHDVNGPPGLQQASLVAP